MELARRGLDAVNKLDFEAACRLFRRLLELRPSVKVLLNLAVAELNGGHPLEAAEHFRAYVLAPDAAPDRAHTVREEFLPKAYAEVGRLMFDVPDGTPIRLNGRAIVAHPGEDNAVLIAPGVARLELSDGRTVRVAVDRGQVAHIVFPPTPIPPSGSLVGAAKAVGPSPREASFAGPVDTGDSLRGARDGEDTMARGSSSSASTKTMVLLGGGLLTAGAIGVGTYFTLAANSADREYANLRADLNGSSCSAPPPWLTQTCSDLKDAYDRGPRERSIALIGWVSAGALGAATLVSWLIWPSARESNVVVVPTPWNGGVAGVATVRF